MLGNGLKNKNYISCMLRSENLMLQTKNELILVQGFLTFVVHACSWHLIICCESNKLCILTVVCNKVLNNCEGYVRIAL